MCQPGSEHLIALQISSRGHRDIECTGKKGTHRYRCMIVDALGCTGDYTDYLPIALHAYKRVQLKKYIRPGSKCR